MRCTDLCTYAKSALADLLTYAKSALADLLIVFRLLHLSSIVVHHLDPALSKITALGQAPISVHRRMMTNSSSFLTDLPRSTGALLDA